MGNLFVFACAACAVIATQVHRASAQSYEFNYSGSIVNWTVPATGVYRITAIGANGGGNFPFLYDWFYRARAGSGAMISGDIVLTANSQISILVGGVGASNDLAGAGGGGSFVSRNNQPLVVAGGGGGAGMGSNGQDGRIDSNGGSVQSLSGGSNGTGGASTTAFAGAGGGFYGPASGSTGFDAANGTSFLSGGNGGLAYTAAPYSSYPTNGGFGGGGAAQIRMQAPDFVNETVRRQVYYNNAGGGGGGFSGGAGGTLGPVSEENSAGGYDGYTDVIGQGGGGGGSFLLDGAANPELISGFNTRSDGNGYVVIEFIVPAPGAAGVIAITGLVAFRRRRR